ncbi:MAG: hypothetical protein ACWA5W_04540 [Phycisphaerales bacterium]
MCLLLLGCASATKNTPSDQIELGRGGGGGLTQELADGSLGTIETDSARGLEIRLWVVDDTQWDALRLLNEYTESQSTSIREQDRQRWADWGFRLVAMPVDEVDGFLGALRTVQPKNIQWLGEFNAWRPVVRAGNLPTQTVRVGDRTRQIESGKPRIIARSWIEPMLGATDVLPIVRLDLGIQVESSRRRTDPRLLGIAHQRTIEDEGPIIDDLLMSIPLDGSQAIVLVGDAPDSDWDALPKGLIEDDEAGSSSGASTDAGDTDNDPSAFGPTGDDARSTQPGSVDSPNADDLGRSGSRSSRGAVQPEVPQIKSLGELMLTSAGSRLERLNQARTLPKRVVVVFLPRVEGGWSMLGHLSSQRAPIGGKQ